MPKAVITWLSALDCETCRSTITSMRIVFPATAFLALIFGAAAQPASQPPPFPDHVWPRFRAGLESSDPSAFSAADGGQTLAMSGREDLVTQPDFGLRRRCQPLMRDGQPVDPLAYIVEAAMATPKVTMINEAHDQPLTRAFIAKVAALLRAKDYTAYGAETFSEGIAEKGGLPVWTDGYYSREPIYGRLMRDLRRQDWRLFAYEARNYDEKWSFQERARQREIQQAANLAAQVKQESGKVLVHVGHGHLTEVATEGRTTLMGTLFKESTGIDPLTVELTAFESPTTEFVVCDPAPFVDRPHTVDIRIGVPKLTFERGRAAWRRQAGERFAEIPATLRRPGQIAIYEARLAGEPATVTPMDRLLLRPGESLPLLLPAGRYDVSVWTEKEGWSSALSLAVAAD